MFNFSHSGFSSSAKVAQKSQCLLTLITVIITNTIITIIITNILSAIGGGVLFSSRRETLAYLRYFVANLRTFWRTFYLPKNAVAQN